VASLAEGQEARPASKAADREIGDVQSRTLQGAEANGMLLGARRSALPWVAHRMESAERQGVTRIPRQVRAWRRGLLDERKGTAIFWVPRRTPLPPVQLRS
jgi:hypothetical protein